MAGFANDVVYANNGDFSIAGSNKGSAANGLNINGQMWIGTTATNVGGTHINVGTLTSPGGTIAIGYSSPNITLDLTGGAQAIETIAGDTGSISGNNVTIFANRAARNAGASVFFTNSGTVSTLNLSDARSNTFLGLQCGNTTTTGIESVGIGVNCMPIVTSATSTVGIGGGCLVGLTTGISNTSIGHGSGASLISGNSNLFLGVDSGSAYTGAESNNILLLSHGVVGDNAVIRIGTNSQTTCFVSGIANVAVTNQQNVVINSTTGQIGTVPQVNFSAYLSSTQANVTGDGTIYTVIFDTILQNTGAGYNNTNGIFTVPAGGAGLYLFSYTIYFSGLIGSAATDVIIACNGTPFNFRTDQFDQLTPISACPDILSGSFILPLTVGQTVKIDISAFGTTKTIGAGGGALTSNGTACVFSGARVG